MKTTKQFITLVAILFSVQVFATSDIQIRTNGNEEVIIEAVKTSGEERIRIFDERGTLLFHDFINEDNYSKTFTLATLPQGKYFVEYENENKINTAVIVKNSDNSISTSNFNKINFKPIIKQENGYWNVGLTNPLLQKVNITVKDVAGYELVEVKNLKGLFVKKTFNINKLPEGDYIVEISCGDKSYKRTLSIK